MILRCRGLDRVLPTDARAQSATVKMSDKSSQESAVRRANISLGQDSPTGSDGSRGIKWDSRREADGHCCAQVQGGSALASHL